MPMTQVVLTVDLVVLRPGASGGLELLLIRRARSPFQGYWALPTFSILKRIGPLQHDRRGDIWKRAGAPALLEAPPELGNTLRRPDGVPSL